MFGKSFPRLLKDLRVERGWTQLELAKRANSTRERISLIESGRCNANHVDVRNLARVFGVTLEAPALPRQHGSELARLFARRNLDPAREGNKVGIWVRLMHARSHYPEVLAPLLHSVTSRPDRRALRAYFSEAVSGSSDEVVLWLHLLSDPASGVSRCSPMRLGYRTLPIMDANDRIVGDRPFPCILLRQPFPCVFFPQIRVRLLQIPKGYPYVHAELDLLVAARLSQRKLRWLNAEMDGVSHDRRQDKKRQQAVRLPRIPVSTEDLKQPGFTQRLMQRIRDTFTCGDRG